jgi:hypothetical protein
LSLPPGSRQFNYFISLEVPMSATAALELPPETAASQEQEPTQAEEVTTQSAEPSHVTGDTPTKTVGQPTPDEQKEAKDTKQVIDTPDVSDNQREELATRIRQSGSLPPALRECLAKVALASAEQAADGKVRVPIDDAIRAIEEALPDFLRVPARGAAIAQHPSGNSFFRGNPDEVSDAEAEEIARGQLTRSGLLRGQRVRMTED